MGKKKWADTLRNSPMMRALRVDKVTLAGLQATTEIHLNGNAAREIPVLQMLAEPAMNVRERCTELLEMVDCQVTEIGIDIVETVSQIGGGSVPGSEIPGYGLQFSGTGSEGFATALRAARPSVIGRISDGCVVLDLRTVARHQLPHLAAAIKSAAAAVEGT